MIDGMGDEDEVSYLWRVSDVSAIFNQVLGHLDNYETSLTRKLEELPNSFDMGGSAHSNSIRQSLNSRKSDVSKGMDKIKAYKKSLSAQLGDLEAEIEKIFASDGSSGRKSQLRSLSRVSDLSGASNLWDEDELVPKPQRLKSDVSNLSNVSDFWKEMSELELNLTKELEDFPFSGRISSSSQVKPIIGKAESQNKRTDDDEDPMEESTFQPSKTSDALEPVGKSRQVEDENKPSTNEEAAIRQSYNKRTSVLLDEMTQLKDFEMMLSKELEDIDKDIEKIYNTPDDDDDQKVNSSRSISRVSSLSASDMGDVLDALDILNGEAGSLSFLVGEKSHQIEEKLKEIETICSTGDTIQKERNTRTSTLSDVPIDLLSELGNLDNFEMSLQTQLEDVTLERGSSKSLGSRPSKEIAKNQPLGAILDEIEEEKKQEFADIQKLKNVVKAEDKSLDSTKNEAKKNTLQVEESHKDTGELEAEKQTLQVEESYNDTELLEAEKQTLQVEECHNDTEVPEAEKQTLHIDSDALEMSWRNGSNDEPRRDDGGISTVSDLSAFEDDSFPLGQDLLVHKEVVESLRDIVDQEGNRSQKDEVKRKEPEEHKKRETSTESLVVSNKKREADSDMTAKKQSAADLQLEAFQITRSPMKVDTVLLKQELSRIDDGESRDDAKVLESEQRSRQMEEEMNWIRSKNDARIGMVRDPSKLGDVFAPVGLGHECVVHKEVALTLQNKKADEEAKKKAQAADKEKLLLEAAKKKMENDANSVRSCASGKKSAANVQLEMLQAQMKSTATSQVRALQATAMMKSNEGHLDYEEMAELTAMKDRLFSLFKGGKLR